MPEITKEYFDDQFDKLGQAIARGFEGAATDLTAVESRLGTRIDKLDNRLATVETKVDKALHVEYVNLEVRVKRIEQKLDIKAI